MVILLHFSYLIMQAHRQSAFQASCGAVHVPIPFLLSLLPLRPEECIPGHVQEFISGNDRVQVAQQGEVFWFDDPALGEPGQGTPDNHYRRCALQRDSRHALAYLREAQPAADMPPRDHVAPTLARHIHIAHASQPIARLRPTTEYPHHLPELHCPLTEQGRSVVVGAVFAPRLARPLQYTLCETDPQRVAVLQRCTPLHSDEVGGGPDVVVVSAEKCCQLLQNVRVPTREDYTGVVPPRCHFTRDGRAGYSRPGDLLPQIRRHPLGQHLGQDAQVTVLDGLHTLCDGEDHHARLQERGQLFARPAHSEGVDPAQSDLGSLESFSGLLELVGADRLGDLALEAGMHAGLFYALDDVAIKVGAYQPYLVAIICQLEAKCRAHDARSQNAYNCHCSPSQKSTVQ